jgi:hypothetical protein
MAGSEALLASQINGGGCLAPPTPESSEAQMLANTLKSFGGLGDPTKAKLSKYERYSSQLPAQLAWRSTSLQQSVQGMGGFINPNAMRMPTDPVKEMGVMMHNGRLVRMNRPRSAGGTMWKTASERANEWRFRPQSATIHP